MSAQLERLKFRARRWAEQHPGEEYRKTVITEDNGTWVTVSRWFYEEACLESDWVGELFALKEPGKSVYVSFETS